MTDQSLEKEQMTREEVLQWICDRAEELGRPPRREELPEEILELILLYFHKWIYALEEAGLRTPSERTLACRARSKEGKSRKKRRRDQKKVQSGQEDEAAGGTDDPRQ